MSTTLQTVYRRHVPFDPANAAHRDAYWRLRTTGKQDPELRFVLDEGFGSVLSMMQSRIADHYAQPAPPDELAQKRKQVKVSGDGK